MMRRRPATAATLAPLQHYLVSGCWGGGLDLDTFLIAGRVLRGSFSELRAIWQKHGASVRAAHPGGEMWAERVLTLEDGDMFSVPPSTCEEHRWRRKFADKTGQ